MFVALLVLAVSVGYALYTARIVYVCNQIEQELDQQQYDKGVSDAKIFLDNGYTETNLKSIFEHNNSQYSKGIIHGISHYEVQRIHDEYEEEVWRIKCEISDEKHERLLSKRRHLLDSKVERFLKARKLLSPSGVTNRGNKL